jgi:hypothetical protein
MTANGTNHHDQTQFGADIFSEFNSSEEQHGPEWDRPLRLDNLAQIFFNEFNSSDVFFVFLFLLNQGVQTRQYFYLH